MPSVQTLLFSPAELAYLHASLSLPTPIRPDGRKPTQFRPLTAETGVLPATNGSARVCFADGTEAIVGVKAEIQKTVDPRATNVPVFNASRGEQSRTEDDEGRAPEPAASNEWLEITVEIPGYRDDDATTVFLASMLSEALVADGEFAKKLVINRRFHWKLYLDIFLISPPLSYPLPLLSLTTHLALLSTRLPRLKSEGDEDPMFDDDWEAATYLYPPVSSASTSRPPITLLVVAIGDNIFFDPSSEELAVAEVALAISVAECPNVCKGADVMEIDSGRTFKMLSMRSIDPPSRLTPPGIPDVENPTTGTSGAVTPSKKPQQKAQASKGVWRAPLGGAKFGMIQLMIQQVMGKGGVANEVLDGVAGVDLS